MKIFPTLGVIAGLSLAVPALAMDMANTRANPPMPVAGEMEQPGISLETTGSISSDPLESGANSFTETQARARIEANGFKSLGAMALDDEGIWRTTAMRQADRVAVGLDFKGNIAITPDAAR